MAPFFEVAAAALRGPLGGRALRRRSDRFIEAAPEALHPVTRAHHRKRDDVLGRRRLCRPLSPRGAAGARPSRSGATSTRWCVPTVPRRLHARARSRPIRSARTPGSARTRTSSICSTSAPSRCRAAMRTDGLPAGVTLIAPAGRDARAGRASARASRGDRRHARRHRTAAAAAAAAAAERAARRRIELAVVGAHLSGMALNHELTSRSAARFLRARATRRPTTGSTRWPAARRDARACCASPRAPDMPSPPKSGRCRAEASAASSPAIPAPLGIGTLRLADGTSAQGLPVRGRGASTAPRTSPPSAAGAPLSPPRAERRLQSHRTATADRSAALSASCANSMLCLRGG